MPSSNSTTAEFTNVRTLFRLIENHLGELADSSLPNSGVGEEKNLTLYLEINTRIKNHVAKKYERVKNIIEDGVDS
jgi:hypothetical protein